jgi:Flp pilus assembly protein TadB
VSALPTAALAALAVAWAMPSPPISKGRGSVPASGDGEDWMVRLRWLWSGLAGVAGACFVSGRWGLLAGLAVSVTTWIYIGRTEPPVVRRHREAAERDLPGLVHLLASALATGLSTGPAVRTVCAAYPGAAADLLVVVPARLALGVDPAIAWRSVLAGGTAAPLAPLARTMVRAHRSGSSVADEVARLADELGETARMRSEERARSVGVKAALPLGLCLLPSFVLIGIVPLVVGLMQSLRL